MPRTPIFAPLLLVATLSCGAEEPACVPGETQRCVCPDLSGGAQSCEPGGLSWSACVCETGDDTGAEPGGTAQGHALYAAYCAACHGADGRGGSGPDLYRELPELSDAELREVIREGEDEMPGFDLESDELSALIQWLRQRFGGSEGDDD